MKITRLKRNPLWFLEKEKLAEIVKNNNTITNILTSLNLSARGDNFRILKERCRIDNIDISHIALGRGHRKNKAGNFKSFKLVEKDIFIKGKQCGGERLKIYLLRFKLKEYQCEACLNSGIYNNKPLSLQIHHVNGDSLDNRIENLQFLCPNCHSQTNNFAGKSQLQKPKIRVSDIEPLWRNRPKLSLRKVARPTKIELEESLKQNTISSVATKYGLKSISSLKKWCKSYGIDCSELSPSSHVNKKAKTLAHANYTPKSKFKYVSWREAGNKWLAMVRDKNRKILISQSFDTEQEAANFIAKSLNSDKLLYR